VPRGYFIGGVSFLGRAGCTPLTARCACNTLGHFPAGAVVARVQCQARACLSGFRVWDALWSGVQGCRAACDCVLPQLRQQVQVLCPTARRGEQHMVGRHMTRLETGADVRQSRPSLCLATACGRGDEGLGERVFLGSCVTLALPCHSTAGVCTSGAACRCRARALLLPHEDSSARCRLCNPTPQS